MTVFSHFPREFSLTLIFRDQSASNENLFVLFDGSQTHISVDLQRTGTDGPVLVIALPGVTVRQPVSVRDGEFNSISLKLEGEYLTIYVNCILDAFLKLESTPDNITITAISVVVLFEGGYHVRHFDCHFE